MYGRKDPVTCVKGSTLYVVDRTLMCLLELVVSEVTRSDYYTEVIAYDGCGNLHSYYAEDFGRVVFTHKQTAEGRLRQYLKRFYK